MKRPLKIAVVSDNHIDTLVEPGSWVLAKAAFKKVAAANPDHVVIAGDLFDCASAMLRDQDEVETFLRKLGLWHRDRLSLVVGNHDIFHTPHHGSWLERAKEFANSFSVNAQENYDALCSWAAELASAEDRLDVRDLFPWSKRLDHVRLSALDTTERTTVQSSNARLNWGDASRVIEAAEPGTRHILAIHNFPEERRASLAESFNGCAGGYSSGDMGRMKLFAEEARVAAVVCGHLHVAPKYEWTLGGSVPVYLMGRTGGVHGTVPTFAVLEVPEEGPVRWTERKV